MPVRSRLKTAVEQVLVRSGVARVARRTTRGRAIVLAYHNIVPRGEERCGEHALHLPQDAFVAHLDHLQEYFEVVPLDALLVDRARPMGARPLAAITFDDAYRGALQAGIPELQRRGLPATVFVPPAFVGGATFWWDALADGGTLAPAVRAHALDTARGADGAIRTWATGAGHSIRVLPAHAAAGSAADLAAVAAIPGMTLGSHSWSHPNLSRLTEAELQVELSRPLEWLQQRFPAALTRVLAYPYGCAGPTVERLAAQAGYSSGLLVTGGWQPRGAIANRYRWPRLNIPGGLSQDGFTLRAAGLFCG